MRAFKIVFCWATPTPIPITYKGDDLLIDCKYFIVYANSQRNVIEDLKGTDSKIISNINKIIEWN